MTTYLVYAPEGAEPKRWAMDGIKFMSPEVIALEKATGSTIMELGSLAERGSFTAMHAFVWILVRRDATGLAYDEFVCATDELQIDGDDEPEPDPKAPEAD